MKKKAIVLFITLICISNIYANNFNFERLNYNRDDFSILVESTISEALSSTLVAYTKVDDLLLDSLTIKIDTLSYVEDRLVLDGEINYNLKNLPIYIELKEKDRTLLLEKLYDVLFNLFKYDLNKLFDTEFEFYLNYNGKISSFNNTNNKFKTGDYIYLEDFEKAKSLGTVSSTFNEVATVNFLYNPSQLVNLKIKEGPKNQLGLNLNYDIDNEIVSVSGEYFYLKSLFFPFDKINLGLSSSYFYSFPQNKNSFSLDLGFMIEMPLSLLFTSTKFLNSSVLYTKAKIGVIIDNEVKPHSAFELGYKKYVWTNWKLALAYKVDSNNNVGNNVLLGFEFMF